MNRRTRAALLVPATVFFAAAALLQGCLLVRSTEHRIKLNENGSGEASMRLTDIRTDAVTDSARIRDFGVMMASADTEGIKDFEGPGRKVTGKHFFVSGDTLSAEITYTFAGIDYVEGLKATDDELYVVINEGREIVKTNGRVRSGERNAHRIVWPRATKRLMFEIREKNQAPGTSLASIYTLYRNKMQGGDR